MNFRRLASKRPGRQGLGGWVKLPAEAIRPTDIGEDGGVKRHSLDGNGAISWHSLRARSTLALLRVLSHPLPGACQSSMLTLRWSTKR
jgi:hypothetical protein